MAPGNISPVVAPARTGGATLQETSGGSRVDQPGLQQSAAPRRSLFSLKVRSAIGRMAFFMAPAKITRGLEPGTSSYNAARLLQVFSKPGASAGQISKSLIATLGKSSDQVVMQGEQGPGTGAQLASQVGKLSNTQLYRLNKRVSNPKMRQVVHGLRQQAARETDPAAKKLMLKAAQHLDSAAQAARGEFNRRGYELPKAGAEKHSLEIVTAGSDTPEYIDTDPRAMQRKVTSAGGELITQGRVDHNPIARHQENMKNQGFAPAAPARRESPVQRELRVFTRDIRELAPRLTSSYALTLAPREQADVNAEYARVNEVARELSAGNFSREAALAGGALNDQLPKTLPDGARVTSMCYKDIPRNLKAGYINVTDARGTTRPLLGEGEIRELASLKGERRSEESVGKVFDKLKQQLGADPQLLYKLSYMLSQNSFNQFAGMIAQPETRTTEQRHVLPSAVAEQLGGEDWKPFTGSPPEMSFTFSQTADNVIVDVRYVLKTSTMRNTDVPLETLDGDATSLSGAMRVIVPKNDEPARIDGVVKLEASLQAALAD